MYCFENELTCCERIKVDDDDYDDGEDDDVNNNNNNNNNNNKFTKHVSNTPGKHEVKELQKRAILGTAHTHTLRKVLM